MKISVILKKAHILSACGLILLPNSAFCASKEVEEATKQQDSIKAQKAVVADTNDVALSKKISSIEFQYLGAKLESTQMLDHYVSLKEGDEYDADKLNSSITALYSSGMFDNIQTEKKEVSDGVKILFKLSLKPKVTEIEFSGNKHIKTPSLLSEISSKKYEVLNHAKLQEDVNKLDEFYEKKGYIDADIKVKIVEQEAKDTCAVIFNVFEGQKYYISKIKFKGNKFIASDDLEEMMVTKPWNLLSWLKKTGRLEEEKIHFDLDNIIKVYQNQGFLDVEVAREKIDVVKKAKGALEIVINIEEGPRYYFGDIKIEGKHRFDEQKVRNCIAFRTNEAFSPQKIEISRERVRSLYGSRGYLNVFPVFKRSLNPKNEHMIDISLSTEEGHKCFINSINIHGNTNTKSKVILRELALFPGESFNLNRVKLAQSRLENTGFFESVSVVPESTDLPNKKNLRVDVEEGKTGRIIFSGAFSSATKFTFGVTLSEGNFDYKNYKNFFRGGGQKGSIAVEFGKKSHSLNLSFEEPWLFDRELAFGFNAYLASCSYSSDYFDEKRKGVMFYLRKRLFEQFIGKLYYNIEEAEVKNLKGASPVELRPEVGKRTISKLGFSVTRDSRDRYLYPTTGSKIVMDTQVAGGALKGKTNYVRLKLDGAKWFLLSRDHEQVLRVSGMLATVKEYGGKRLPISEKEFLGGPEDLKAFRYRHVGPMTNDQFTEPLGGRSAGFASAEYTIKLIRQARLALFTDAGYVNKKAFRFGMSDLYTDAGVGLRIMVLGMPINLNLAFPIKSDDLQKKKCRFSFSGAYNY